MEIIDNTVEYASQQFATKRSACDDREFSIDEAESRDFLYLLQNSCMECNRALRKEEIKVIPPRYMQERDAYVRSGIVYRRYMCVPCYNAIRSPLRFRERVKTMNTYRNARARVIKSILHGLLSKQRQ